MREHNKLTKEEKDSLRDLVGEIGMWDILNHLFDLCPDTFRVSTDNILRQDGKAVISGPRRTKGGRLSGEPLPENR